MEIFLQLRRPLGKKPTSGQYLVFETAVLLSLGLPRASSHQWLKPCIYLIIFIHTHLLILGVVANGTCHSQLSVSSVWKCGCFTLILQLRHLGNRPSVPETACRIIRIFFIIISSVNSCIYIHIHIYIHIYLFFALLPQLQYSAEC